LQIPHLDLALASVHALARRGKPPAIGADGNRVVDEAAVFECRRDIRPGGIPDAGALAGRHQQPVAAAEKRHRSDILIETQGRRGCIRPIRAQAPHRRLAAPGADRNAVEVRAEGDIPYPVAEIGGPRLVARGAYGLAQRILGLGSRRQEVAARLVGRRDRDVQGSRRVGLRHRGDVGGARIRLGTVMLEERIQPAGNRDQRKGRRGDQQPPLPAAASRLAQLLAGRLALLSFHVAVAPVDQRRGEHVMIDLVVCRLGLVHGRCRGAQDALLRQGMENLRHMLAQGSGPAREVVAGASHLAPARRHEAVEEGGADGLAGLVEL
jgi:hypothetical protein